MISERFLDCFVGIEGFCLQERFAAQAGRTPEATAVVAGHERLSYRELHRRSLRLARALRGLNVGPEVRVAVCLERTADLVVALLGVLAAGGAYVPFDPAYPEARLALLLGDAAAPVLLTTAPLLDRLPALAASGSRIVCLDRELPPPAALSGLAPTLDNLAYVIYTSGSTGRPKGVAVCHRSASALVDWAARTFGPERLSGVLAATSICFDLSVFEIFVPLSLGGTVHLAENALALPTLPSAGEVTLVNTVPSALAQLLRSGGLPAGVSTVNLAGEALPGALVREIHERTAADQVWNLYGPSEDTVYSTAARVEPGVEIPPIGRPVAGTRAALLDPVGDPVPEGEPGELHLAGEGLARGYLGRPDWTAERFLPDPRGEPGARRYRTGDLVRRREDGLLLFLGRLDHQVKIRGFRIELGEIEAALGRHPAVERAVVAAREDSGEKRLVAYAVPRSGATLPDAREARAFLRRTLPEHMVPAAFVALPAFPLLPNGKIDRGSLPAPFFESAGYEAPRTPLEEAVAGIWAEVLGYERISVHDSFFDQGGHSLSALQVVSRVREALGVELAAPALFTDPTVAGLARRIGAALAGERGAAAPPLRPRQPLQDAGRAPLSFVQEGLWFLAQLAPESPFYNVPAVLRLTGELAPGALASSLGEIVRRHEALRTTFGSDGSAPVQGIAPAVAIPLPLADLTALPVSRRDGESERLAREEALRPFDLGEGPLLRLLLVRTAAGSHSLVLNLHHIVSDGWSIAVFVEELAALYRAAVAGRPSPLPELPVQYADYALWQRSWLAGDALAAQLAYWRERLAGAPPLHDLPGDRPRPAVQSFRGAVLVFRLPAGLSRELSALARREGGTLFMGLLAAFQTLLLRLTDHEDQVVGSAFANRGQRATERLIGFFANMLVLRTRMRSEGSFREALARVREEALGALAHQELPFEKLVFELAPERDLSRNPLFQLAFVLQGVTEDREMAPGLTLSREEIDWKTAHFDLTFHAWDRPEGIEGRLAYATDLFDRTTITRLAEQLERLILGVVAEPDRPLAALDLLSGVERENVLRGWNRTARDYPRESSIPALFSRVAGQYPERVALVAGAESLTYGELDRRAGRLARRLAGLGVGPDVLVGLFLERSLGMVVSTLGVLKAGGAYLPLDVQYPAERLASMLGDARPAALVTDRRLAAKLPESETPRIFLEDLEADREEGTAPPVSPDPLHLAYVMYTSGSTGRPKGVAAVQRGVVRLVQGNDFAELTGERVFLQMAPTAFDAATLEIWGPLLNGGRLAVLPPGPASLEEIAAAILAHGVDTVWLTAGLFHLLAQENLGALSPLRQLLAGGDVLSPSHVERALAALPGCRLINGYGPTESTTFTCCHGMSGPQRLTGSVPIGRPIANTRVYLLDRRAEPVPPGVAGELHIGGDGLARGYLGRPERTAERFVPHPYPETPGERLYRTGDLARWRPEGAEGASAIVEFLGRTDHQVKVRGFRIELGEIESALVKAPGVEAAVVLAREDVPGERRLVAYVTPETADPEILRSHLAERLPEPMLPAVFVALPALPLSPNGKVDRRALPAPAAPESGDAQVAPRTPLEEKVAAIWAGVLGQERIGVHDDFFARGGHSLSATQVVSRVRDALGVSLSVRALFEQPTVFGLARRIAEAQASLHPATPPLRPLPRDGHPPLSFAQEGLWFLAQLAPESPFYNVPAALRLHGSLDPAALARSLAEIVRRHEALRTTFGHWDGTPVQVIAPAVDIPLPVVDLSALPAGRREGESARLAQEEALRPFDLARGPLLRLLFLRTAATEHTLVLDLHHIVADGRSVEVFLDELSALYRAAATGTPSALPELPVQYADFALSQRSWLNGEALAAQLAYWRERLAGAPPLHGLLGDRPRPAVQSFRGAVHTFQLPAALSRGLAALARREGGTLFIGLLAAFKTLLFRLTEQEDQVVGSAVANRGRSEVEGLIGFFANMLALRTRVNGEGGYRQALALMREGALGALAHQELPFEKVVLALAPERDLSRNPLFQLAFVLQEVTADREIAPGLTLSREELDWKTAHFDLIFHAWDRPEGIEGRLAYATDLFDRTTIARIAEQLERLILGVVAEPDRPLAALDLLSGAERENVLRGWNRTARDYPRESSIPDLFSRVAGRYPERVALVAGAQSLTYGELDRRAGRLARRLAGLGVGPDVLVGLFLERSLGMMVSTLGVLKTGGAYLPLDVQYPAERLASMLGDARPAALVTDRRLAAKLPESETPRIFLEDLEADRQEGTPPAISPDPLHLAYVMYTSGSTGRPKGVAAVHRGVVRLVQGNDFAELTGERVFLQMAPTAFDAATLEIWGPLLNGGRLAVLPPGPASLEEIAAAILVHGVDTVWLTAGLFHLLAQENLGALSPLRQLLAGGDVLSPSHVERALAALPGCRLINGYGPTESTTFTCCHGMSGPQRLTGPVPIGRPIANTRVYLLDRRAEPVPPGVAGELHIGGDGLARGYLGSPERTAERFVPHPYPESPGERLYRTGDLARWRPEGAEGGQAIVEFLGRTDHQVKVRGFRIELGEIESALRAAPGVEEAVVLAREDVPGERRLVAYVTPETSETLEALDPAALRAFLAERLPDYMVPGAFVALPALPLSPNGKVDRRALPAPAEREKEDTYVAPRNPVEETLARIWAELLALPRIGVHDDFFLHGGHSLMATRVASRLREAFGVELPLRQLFEARTVAQLAEVVQGARSERESPPAGEVSSLCPVPRDGELPLSFPQQRLWFLDRFEPGGNFYNVPAAFRLLGALDRRTLERALAEIVRRHESLRTTVPTADSQPRQRIAAPAPLTPVEVDLTGLPPAAREAEAQAVARTEAERPFDLARGPLFRATLVSLAPLEHVLVLNLHHLIADGWSIGVLAAELSALYRAFSKGEPSPLPELPIQYADFAAWQRRHLAGEVLEGHLDHWRRHLAGAPPALHLPTDRPRPPVQSFRGLTRGIRLPAELSRAVRALCQREGATLFMALLATFQVLLYRWSGQDDVVVGVGIANRTRRETEGLIGFFVNTLALRTSLAGNPTFGELLRRVREASLGAYAHQDLPFEKVVEELRPPRDLSRNPLVQVAFVLQNAPMPPFELPGLTLVPLDLEVAAAKFDWLLSLSDTEPEITGLLEYSSDLFRPETVERALAQYATLLEAFTQNPGRRIRTVPLVSAELAEAAGLPAARIEAVAPVNTTQRDLFLDHARDPESTIYSLAVSVPLGRTVDPERWGRAVASVTAAEPMTRVRFLSHHGEILQVVERGAAAPFSVVDLPAADPEPAWEALLRERAKAPYRLERGGLFHSYLVRGFPGGDVALVAFHHITADAFSGRLFFERVAAAYEGREPEAAGRSFFAAVGESLARFDTPEVERFWAERLGRVATLELHGGMARPARPARPARDTESRRLLGGEALAAVRSTCGEELSLAAFLRGLFGLLLDRIFDPAGDLLLYDVVGGRTREEARTLGCFHQVVPVVFAREGFAEDCEIADYFRAVRGYRRALGEMQNLSVLLARRAVRDERLRFYYNFYNFDAVDLLGRRAVLRVHDSFPENEVHLIVSSARERGEEIELALHWNERSFADLNLLDRLLSLAGQVAGGARHLRDLDPLLPAERRQILLGWNDTAVAYPGPADLRELLEEQAFTTPEAVAVQFEREALTYRELHRRANRLAHHLRRLGAGPETIVATAVPRSLDMALALLAILKAGAAYLPLDPDYPEERLRFMLADSGAPVLLLGTKPLPGSAEYGGTVVRLGEISTGTGGLAGEPDTVPALPSRPDGLAYVIYTSGSTGRPKGAMNVHRAIANRLLWMQAAYRLSADDRVLQKTPLSFDVSVWEVFWPLTTGARLVIARPDGHRDSAYLARLIREEEVTTLHFVPSMLRIFLEERDLEGCRSLRRVIASGEALPREVVERFFSRLPGGLHNLYGPTEAAVDVTFWACERAAARTAVPIGRPVGNTAIYLLDRELRPVPAGLPGELWIGGVQLARGYLGRPELTAERFLPDPYGNAPGGRIYKTGDLARHLPDGAIEYLGRLDHQVKLRGFRIELGEIESALRRLPAVREALVLVREDAPGDRALVAYLVAPPDLPAERRPGHGELAREARLTLPDSMVPAHFVWLPELPLLPNGKADRRALPAPASERPDLEVAYAAAESDAERRVVGIWQEVLRRERVGAEDNFFDLGGHSLLLVEVQTRVRELFGREVSIVELFRHPTARALARHLDGRDAPPREAAAEARERTAPAISERKGRAERRTAIAVVGMAGRFPKVRSLSELWERLRDGDELISFYTEDELAAAGVDRAVLARPGYVRAKAALDAIDLWDAAFFGYSPREAEILDPQQRLFLEAAWEALEDAGYDPSRTSGKVGVFAGQSLNTYLMANLYPNPRVMEAVGLFQVVLGNDKDYLATRTSYKLGLKGPSVGVQTACSTSLVAVHLACQSLLDGDCDLALAGGVSVTVPEKSGYFYQPGSIVSPDGHCRPFDRAAEGTVPGNGLGLVVLKRLADAERDGDTIRAVILGSSINNDGADKMGFTAPSADGQAEVIAAALARAGVDAGTIGLVEAHGTGTPLGDPIEVAALTQVYRRSTAARGAVALGSIKSNLGHLDAAAGVAGLVKAVLALEHGELPPSLHFTAPNPDLGLAESPFAVVDRARAWPAGETPRRAAVSSFGIGGTNAHVILEEAPAPAPAAAEAAARPRLLLLSARTPTALASAAARLAEHLRRHPELPLADVEWTLAAGRRVFPHRRALLARDREQTLALLAGNADRESRTSSSRFEESIERPIAFLFPGQGSQHVAMAAGLYAAEKGFRERLDRSAEILAPRLGIDLRQLLYPAPGHEEEARERLDRTEFTQPALFAVEHALAGLFLDWGLRPVALLGHSVGELVAATLSGVFDLEDALSLIALRGELVGTQPPGAMLSVPLPEPEALELLDRCGPELSLAAVNGPALVAVAGDEAPVERFARQLGERGIACRRLHTSHAFHSHRMDPVVGPFAEAVGRLALKPPRTPFLSGTTGTWITPAEATDPGYWARHLRQPIRFADGVAALAQNPDRLLLEVGPGNTLSTLARRQLGAGALVLSSLPHPKDRADDLAVTLEALGRLWLSGVRIDWEGYQKGERRRRVPLPTYPFERQRYWVDPVGRSLDSLGLPATPGETAGSEAAPVPALPAHAGPPRLREYVPPETEIEEVVAAVWQELLGVESVGREDRFFELGGHSLMGIQVIARLQERFPVELPVDSLFDRPTLADFAELVEERLLDHLEQLSEGEALGLMAEAGAS